MCDCVRLLRDPGGALGDYTRARHDRALNNASSTIRGSQLGENDEENARCNGRRLFVAIGIASAAGPPEQKEGLRSIHRQSIDNSGNQKTESSLTICRSHAYDAYTLSLVKNKKVGRTTLKEDWQGSNYSAESWQVRLWTARERFVTQAIHRRTPRPMPRMLPALGGISDTTMIMDQKYVGSCPAATQPGDLTNADGRE